MLCFLTTERGLVMDVRVFLVETREGGRIWRASGRISLAKCQT
jgi:hypothetical protein